VRIGEPERDEYAVDRARHDRGLKKSPRSNGRRRPAGFGEPVQLRQESDGAAR
jgi:hypothetical protein